MSTWKSVMSKFGRPESPSGIAQSYPPLLLVDDEPEILETLQSLFEESGYPIRQASNGQEALALLRASQERHIIVLDNVMPVLDGEGVLREILRDKHLRRRHAIILVSAMARLSRRLSLQRLLQSLSIETITKPFNIADLEHAVERARAKLQH
jgi:CheY-like chemotaxis protein